MKTILTSHVLALCMLMPFIGLGQLVTVSGKITDSKSGDPLENVSVFETNSSIGTISNSQGFSKLFLNQGDFQIKVSHNGYNEFTQSITVKNDTVLTVQLIPEVNLKSSNKKQTELHAEVGNSNKRKTFRAWFANN